MHRKLALGAFLISFLIVGPTASQELKLRSVQTDDMRLVYYDPAHEYIIPHLSRCFVNSLRFHEQLFGYKPSERVTIILRDLNDHGYAGATSLPYNYLILGMEPFEQVYETSPTNERLNWVMSHELLHVVASDQTASTDRFWRKAFHGKVMATGDQPMSMIYSYLTSPRMYAPRWFHEGMAVFLETWMAGGYGRALGGYDEMVFRTMVAENARFYDVVGLESEGKTIDFQIGQVSYLYGTRFICYLALEYGPDTVIEWLNRNDGSRRNFATQFKKVYGTGLDEEWSKWIEFEHQWQATILDSIYQYPVTGYRELTRRALGSVSRICFDSKRRKIYAGVLYPGTTAHIVEVDLDSWESRKIIDIDTPALYYVLSLAYDENQHQLFYTTDNSHQWRDLRVVDIKTGKSRVLQKDIRTGDLAYCKADSILWGIRHHNGFTRLVMIPPPYDGGYEIIKLPYGRDLFDIDVSPDGLYVTGTLSEINGTQRLIRMRIEDLLTGQMIFETLYLFPSYAPANFVYSPDGKFLYGTSYSTGVSNVTRYDFENKRMDWLTNAATGYFRPVPVSSDSLIAFRYRAKGFQPVMIADEPIYDVAAIRFLGQAIVDRHPIVKDWMLGSPLDVEIDTTAFEPFDYRGLRDVRLGTVYPILEVYKDRVAYGVRLNFQDPMWLHGIDLTASYTPSPSGALADEETPHVTLKYDHWPWTIKGTVNRADFYDFFGPTKTSRRGYSVGLKYDGVFTTDRPRKAGYWLATEYWSNLETLPDAQNIAASFSELLYIGANINFKSMRRTIGGVEPEKGIRLDVNGMVNRVPKGQGEFPRYWVDVDYGFLLPWDHSSIWLRGSTGKSHGDRDEPFANFFFGAFGNNWVDHQGVSRYRSYYSFPGIEINAAGGITYAKMMLEWTMPPLRFRRLGFPRFYTTWAHLKFFTTGLTTNFDDARYRTNHVNFGAQIDFKTVIFATMSSTLSFGYATAVTFNSEIDRMMFNEASQKQTYEFMISLKIL